VSDLVFFYGTLMTPFNRPGRQRITTNLHFLGRGAVPGALFDLGIYPAAIPATDGSQVWGELYRMHDPAAVLATLDELEGYRSNEPERSLYVRALAEVALEDGSTHQAWAYFYNAPLGHAQRIASGDYLDHLNVPR
jgi:gamma-glutamylcyclotransferase (GGCT)/AIG2-like uncharacterized protein YtfP